MYCHRKVRVNPRRKGRKCTQTPREVRPFFACLSVVCRVCVFPVDFGCFFVVCVGLLFVVCRLSMSVLLTVPAFACSFSRVSVLLFRGGTPVSFPTSIGYLRVSLRECQVLSLLPMESRRTELLVVERLCVASWPCQRPKSLGVQQGQGKTKNTAWRTLVLRCQDEEHCVRGSCCVPGIVSLCAAIRGALARTPRNWIENRASACKKKKHHYPASENNSENNSLRFGFVFGREDSDRQGHRAPVRRHLLLHLRVVVVQQVDRRGGEDGPHPFRRCRVPSGEFGWSLLSPACSFRGVSSSSRRCLCCYP